MDNRVVFERSLYLPEAVEAAAAAFAEHASIELTAEGDTVVAAIAATGAHDASLVVNAFCNYVLQETIARMRQAGEAEVA